MMQMGIKNGVKECEQKKGFENLWPPELLKALRKIKMIASCYDKDIFVQLAYPLTKKFRCSAKCWLVSNPVHTSACAFIYSTASHVFAFPDVTVNVTSMVE